jgi:pimeloyl-ACP methyl ester carboxylesterase
MPFITTTDGVKLAVEITGEGKPLVFVHEFAGDMRSWEQQVRAFSRRYRCITFNARGYPPSDVPGNLEQYSQMRAAEDIRDVIDGLKLGKAHVVGLSMGGFAALHFGMKFPDRALSLVLAGAGYGAEKAKADEFRAGALAAAAQFESLGAEKFSHIYGSAAARIPLLLKDPRGWDEHRRILGEHSSVGAALTLRGVQARRPSIYDFEAGMRAMTLPTLIVSGDEDDHCLQPALFMKRHIPASGLVVLPKVGHAINLEEPALFNAAVADFLAQVELGRWLPRDPRCNPDESVKTR